MAERINQKEQKRLREIAKKYPFSFEELISFYRATYKAYLSILARKPDIVITPLRGAEPMAKAIKLFASLERKSSKLPRFFFPRIGQQTVESGITVERFTQSYAKAISEEEKRRELGRILDKAFAINHRTPEILVLDEVFQGGSITKTIRMLEEHAARRKRPIRVKAIAIAQEGQTRTSEYYRLKSSRTIEELHVKKLFTMDSPNFLRPLVEDKGFLGWTRKRPKMGVSQLALKTNLDMLGALSEIHAKKRRIESQALRRIPKTIIRRK